MVAPLGVLFGGNANNGSNAGFVYANSNNTPSTTNANIGSHLYFSIIILYMGSGDRASWQKISLHKGAGRNARRIGHRRLLIRKAKLLMKRIGNLYQKIISIENLKLADEKARKGKQKTYGVRMHDKNREKNILALHEALLTKTFKTSEYDIFTIHEPKEREIYRLPYYPDRILHHAIMNVMEPIWTSLFTADTYSCIKGRGIHGVVNKMKRVMKDVEHTKYCLKIDVRKFYPSIDHDVLKQLIRKKIKCKDTLDLLYEIIDSADGIPIGNYLSQFFANIYLTYFDHWMKEVKKVRYYFRYADDIVVLSPSKDELFALYSEIKLYFCKIKLVIKDNFQVFPIAYNKYDKSGRGLDFCGYIFYHNQTLIRKTIKKNFCRKVHQINKRANITIAEYKKALSSWIGWAKHCNGKHLIKTTIKKDYYGACVL